MAKREMERIVLKDKDVTIKLEPDKLAHLLRLEPGSEHEARFGRLAREGMERARPGALYKPVFIAERGPDYIVCDGTRFTSRVLAVNVEKVYRIFPFVATSGLELDQWWIDQKDPLHHFWAGTIKGFVLLGMLGAVESHIKDRYATGNLARMNPGSLEDWPLSEQQHLFQLLGDVSSLGVELKEDMFMRPDTTVSGLWFPSEIRFESCMLCPMEQCPGRRAPFDKGLFANKYGTTG